MVTLQLLTDCPNPAIGLRPCGGSSSPSARVYHYRSSQTRIVPRASHHQQQTPPLSLNRRQVIAETATGSLALLMIGGFEKEAKSEDTLSEWERVYLPIDPGVVLLDIAFVPEDPNHGNSSFA